MIEPKTPPETALPAPANDEDLVPEWVLAEATLQEQLADIDQAGRDLLATWVETSRSELIFPLRRAIEEVAHHHRQLMTETAFTSDSPLPVKDLWQRILAYREAVCIQVITPIQAHLDGITLSTELSTSFLDLLHKLAALSADLPQQAEVDR